jgi:5-methylcytosine-specific restriction protein A
MQQWRPRHLVRLLPEDVSDGIRRPSHDLPPLPVKHAVPGRTRRAGLYRLRVARGEGACHAGGWDRMSPRRALKPCPQPGCRALVERGRCAGHRLRPTRQQQGYTNEWLRLSRAAIADQPWCSRCGSTDDLTADHIVPLSAGGESVIENMQTLCRSCNSRKGGRAVAISETDAPRKHATAARMRPPQEISGLGD